MIKIRKSAQRGKTVTDWLNSLHTFSFGEYYDPQYHGFGTLRVINEDTVAPGQGFGTHGHQDMEIISYVVDGTVEHKDSMGNGSNIRSGEIQRMSAGTGVRHSEFNHSHSTPVHFLQIWIIPETKGLPPSYEQKPIIKVPNQWILLGDARGNEQAIKIHQDVSLYAAYMTAGTSLDYLVAKDRSLWVQLVKGEIQVNEHNLHAGDGAAIIDESKILVQANDDAELLLFDLAVK